MVMDKEVSRVGNREKAEFGRRLLNVFGKLHIVQCASVLVICISQKRRVS